MLFTLGKISSGDYGEESLVSRLLLATVFNEYAVVNKEGRAFVAFARRCLMSRGSRSLRDRLNLFQVAGIGWVETRVFADDALCTCLESTASGQAKVS